MPKLLYAFFYWLCLWTCVGWCLDLLHILSCQHLLGHAELFFIPFFFFEIVAINIYIYIWVYEILCSFMSILLLHPGFVFFTLLDYTFFYLPNYTFLSLSFLKPFSSILLYFGFEILLIFISCICSWMC